MLVLRLLALAVGAVGAAVVVSTGIVHRAAGGRMNTLADAPSAPVALVLGARVEPDQTPSRFLAGRLEVGRRLWEAGRVEQLIVSGAGDAPEGDEPAVMRAWLLDRGVPAAVVITDGGGLDTYDSCVRARDVFGVRRLLLVSQTYHLPRAVGTARMLGLDAYGVGDDSVRTYDDADGTHRSCAWRQGVLREWVACVKTLRDVASRRPSAVEAREVSRAAR